MKRMKMCAMLVLAAVMLLSVGEKAFADAQRIGSEAALQAALDEAGLTAEQVTDVDVEFERNLRASWYEVDFESGWREYEFKVDAYTGEILSSSRD